MRRAIQIVRDRDLEAFWGVLKAREPGHMRSLITWMGGPDGYINTNPGQAIVSQGCAVGIMDMGPGNRQPGVHTHTMTEIYVILEGEVESFDGVGNRHRAGPFDCLYIPKGVPHGVRTVGQTPVSLLWVNDDVEKWGVSHYQEGPGPHPADDTVHLITFDALEPNWTAPKAAPAGHMRWNVSWVACRGSGIDYNSGVAAASERVGISLCVLQPANKLADGASSHSQLYVVVKGRGVATIAGRRETLGKRDAIFCPAGETLDLRALDEAPLYLVRIEEPLV